MSQHKFMSRAGETYRAVQAIAPHTLVMVDVPLRAPSFGWVRLRVEACGVCHSDALTIEGRWPGLTFPRVPGHEVIGRIDALGGGVEGWSLGQRVGVGFLGAPCGHCPPCRRGDLADCRNHGFLGASYDGGYAEVMLAEPGSLISIPDEVDATNAAPLLGAGLTAFNALRHSSARAGDLVVVLGIGGLGHLALQIANRLGFQVVAVARGGERRALSLRLGAHIYIDSEHEDPAATLQALGGAALVIATAANGKAMSAMLGCLRERGAMIVLGASADPLEVPPTVLLYGQKSLHGLLAGSPLDGDEALAFFKHRNVVPMVETMPLARAVEAYDRMMAGAARFRMVLTMKPPP